MNTLLEGLLGAGAGLGLFIAVAAWRGEFSSTYGHPLQQRLATVEGVGARVGLACAGLVIVGGLTRWPAAAVVAAAAAWMAPDLRNGPRRREQALARTEAIALWAEMLRDTLAAGGLRDAVRANRRVAPAAIRAEVGRLADRAEFTPLGKALRQFATEVDDPVCDAVVAALVIGVERQASGLRELLCEVARSALAMAAMRLRVEAGRAKTYQQARFVIGFTLAFAAILIVTSPGFMKPYGSLTGQGVLGLIGALFVASLWGLNRLARPTARARLLAAIREAT